MVRSPQDRWSGTRTRQGSVLRSRIYARTRHHRNRKNGQDIGSGCVMAETWKNVLAPDELCAPDANGHWDTGEAGAARRLGWEFAGRLRWVQDKSKWFVYREGRWVKEGLEESKAAAMSISVRQIIDHNGEGSQTATFIKNVLTLSKRWLAISTDAFDNDPLLLCCLDGVVSLRREDCGLLLEHQPEYLMTLSTRHNMRHLCDERGFLQLPEDWGWKFYAWEEHLYWMTQTLEAEDKKNGTEKALEFRDFFARWSGSSTIGDQNKKPQKFLNLTGTGMNGKGASAIARVHALGGYGKVANPKVLTRKQSDHSTELAGLEGIRLLIIEELTSVPSAGLKDLTGGGELEARKMRQDDVTFAKSWSTELLSNQPISLSGEATTAIRRRKLVANLGEVLPTSVGDDTIVDRLKTEPDIILAWMIAYGLRRFYGNKDAGIEAGLAVPAWMEEEASSEIDEDDIVGTVLTEQYYLNADGKVLTSLFTASVNEMKKKLGFSKPEDAMSPAQVGNDLRGRGFVVKKADKNKSYVFGISPSILSAYAYGGEPVNQN